MIDGREALVAYNTNTDQIKVGALVPPGSKDWTRAYFMTSGAAYVNIRQMSEADLGSYYKAEFIAAVVRDGVCIKAAYREFRKIKQFVDWTPEDMPNECL